MLTLDQVRGEFPEAEEQYRGWGQTFVVDCRQPHKRGGKGEMEINPETGYCHCHNCGWSGSAKDFGLDATDRFFDTYRPNQNLKPIEPRGRTIRRGGIMWGTDIPAPGQTVAWKDLPDDHVAVEYLRKRDFNIEELRDLPAVMQLYYCTQGQMKFNESLGSTTGRIIFPIYMSGADPTKPELRGWQARQIDYLDWEDDNDGERRVWNGKGWTTFRKIDGEWQDRFVAKYYTMPGMRRSDILYNFDVARQYTEIAVVEGPLDVLRVGPKCAGTIGGAVSIQQARLLKTYWSKVFILRDPNVTSSDKKFQKLLAELSGIQVIHLNLANGKDPGATPRESTWSQIAAAEAEKTRTTHRPSNN